VALMRFVFGFLVALGLAAGVAARVGVHLRNEPAAPAVNVSEAADALAEATRTYFRDLLHELQALPDLTDDEMQEQLRDRMNDLKEEQHDAQQEKAEATEECQRKHGELERDLLLLKRVTGGEAEQSLRQQLMDRIGGLANRVESASGELGRLSKQLGLVDEELGRQRQHFQRRERDLQLHLHSHEHAVEAVRGVEQALRSANRRRREALLRDVEQEGEQVLLQLAGMFKDGDAADIVDKTRTMLKTSVSEEDVLKVIHTLSHLVNVINDSAAQHSESLEQLRKDWKEQEEALVGRRRAIKGQEKSTARMLRTAKAQLNAARTRLELLVLPKDKREAEVKGLERKAHEKADECAALKARYEERTRHRLAFAGGVERALRVAEKQGSSSAMLVLDDLAG